MIVYFVTRDPAGTGGGQKGAAYQANIWIFNVFNLALSVAFLVYGIWLIRTLNRGLTNRHSVGVVDSRNLARQRAAFMKVMIINFFFVFFLTKKERSLSL